MLGLVKAFLKAGILTEDGGMRDTDTGTPQGGILSPLLANIALSALDDHFARAWEAMGRTGSARNGADAAAWRPTASSATRTTSWSWSPAPRARRSAAGRGGSGARPDGAAPVGGEDPDRPHRRGLRLPRLPHPAATQARQPAKRYVYTYPSKTSLAAVKAQGQGDHPAEHEPDARQPAAPAQPGAAGLERLLPRTACPRRPSTTCAPSLGAGSSTGCAASTPRRTGTGSAAATSPGGGRPTARRCSSTPPRCRSPATATAARTSPRRGQPQRDCDRR